MYLNTHSYFSFKYGVMSTDDLLSEAQSKGIDTLVLTDINSTAGCMRFIRDASKYNIRPIVGVDFRNDNQQKFVAIARNNEGFREINEYLSHHLHQQTDIPDRAPAFEQVFILYPFHSLVQHDLQAHEYIGIAPEHFLKVPFSKWKNQKNKLAILRTVTFRHESDKSDHKQTDFNIHRLLRAIHHNTLLTKLRPEDVGSLNHHMLPNPKVLMTYQDYDATMIENTQYILDRSSISFEFGDGYPHKNIRTYTQSEEEDYQLLRKKSIEGIPYRYPKPDIKLYRRLALELNVIRQKGFVSYFLVNWDIIQYALRKNYFYVGRGSGANSIIAYLLRITDVDPLELDLYFERFINLYRKNPPDFDIDFSWRDRDDITRYIFERFGYEKTSLLATYTTFQFKAAVREISKACGLPPHEIDAMTHIDKDDRSSAASRTHGLERVIFHYAEKLNGIPSHLSVHASGIIIAENPIFYYTATSLPPKGFSITHFDMTEAEDVGLFKFDILSQRGLGKIKDTLEIIRYNHPDVPPIDIHDTRRFFEDEKIKYLLSNGLAIGCFYVESPAMRMLLKKLKADHYLGLVAASSIIRPGVAKSGMMREYIIRFRKPERRKEAHPVLNNLMPETFGIMVYQEDVIKVAHYFAGLSLAEADRLRRGMSGKYRSREEFKEVERRYFEECTKKGHPPKLIREVWHQIMSFAGYAFAKGHSASYAIESYQCLFLKAHYPLEYMVSIINNGGGFYSHEIYIYEARRHGAQVELPCFFHSQHETIIKGKTIYLGFHLVNGLEKQTIYEILNKRVPSEQIKQLESLINIINISLEQLKVLIRVGALRTIDHHKKKLLWEAHMLLTKEDTSQPTLFRTPTKKYELPILHHDHREDGFDEMELLDFTLKNPFGLIQPYHEPHLLSHEIIHYVNKSVTLLGYLVTIKSTRTSNGKRMIFGTFIDQQGDFIDTVHFPPSAKKYPIRGKGVYEIKGKVVEEFDFLSIEVSSLNKVHYINIEDELMKKPSHRTAV